MQRQNSALVLSAGSLGDSLLTLPALHLLQSRFQVTVAGTSPYQALGAKLLGVTEVLPLDPLLQSLLSKTPLNMKDQSFLTRFKEIFIFFKDKDEFLLEKLASLSGVQVHFPAKPFNKFLQEVRWAAEYWLETALACPLGPDAPFRQAKLHIDESLKIRGHEILKSLHLTSPLIIHPGSGSPDKNAPLPFFRSAAERAGNESQKQVLVTWGEAEEKNLELIREAFAGLKNVVVLAQPLSLQDLAGVFSQSAAYLGNDSGVTQLAAACGLRTFAVFQSTDARVWGPQEAIILSAMKNLYK